MLYFADILVFVFAIAGIVLTVLSLPGTWLAVLVAAVCKLWQPDTMSWWVIAAAAALATLAEVVEFAASAVGTAKAGGSKRGGVGSLVGGLAGAIFGAPFFFGLGAIPGAVIGAGLGAVAAEKAWAKRSWGEAGKSGQGAAVGRLVATVLKVAFAMAIALLLTIAMTVNLIWPPARAGVPAPVVLPPATTETPGSGAARLDGPFEIGKESSDWNVGLHSGLPLDWPTLYAGATPGRDVSGRG